MHNLIRGLEPEDVKCEIKDPVGAVEVKEKAKTFIDIIKPPQFMYFVYVLSYLENSIKLIICNGFFTYTFEYLRKDVDLICNQQPIVILAGF